MQRGMYKKATYEDKFYRYYCCGKENHNSSWANDKRRNRKLFRTLLKRLLRKELKENEAL